NAMRNKEPDQAIDYFQKAKVADPDQAGIAFDVDGRSAAVPEKTGRGRVAIQAGAGGREAELARSRHHWRTLRKIPRPTGSRGGRQVAAGSSRLHMDGGGCEANACPSRYGFNCASYRQRSDGAFGST